MTVRSVIIPPAASQGEQAHCLLAIELSLKSWVVAIRTPLSDKVSLHKMAAGIGKLLELIERVRRRAEAALGTGVEVLSCYEAGYDGFWLHRVLQENGVKNHVIDPACLQVNRRARAGQDGSH
jgi:transposase